MAGGRYSPANLAASWRTGVVLAVFAILFIVLTVSSYTRQSATWDEPQHLLTGYAVLTQRDYRLDPEHPPFLRAWAALPLLARSDVQFSTEPIDQSEPGEWVGKGQFFFCHGFLYWHNDADRLLYAGRFMIVLLGILLGGLVYIWARQLYGWPVAGWVLAFLLIEPNLLAHSSLVTTDLGFTCFFVGTGYFLWRTMREVTGGNVLGLILFFALSVISKYSSVVLGAAVIGLLLLRAVQGAAWPGRLGQLSALSRRIGLALSLSVLLIGSAWGALWAAYDFRYRPSPLPDWQWQLQSTELVSERTPGLARVVDWCDRHRLLPQACAQGFLLGQAKAQKRGAFLAGQYSTEGWWYYFPFAILIKTPISLLLLGLTGLAVWLRSPDRWKAENLCVWLPPGLFVGAAIMAHLNIGLRHVLPFFPFAVLWAGRAIVWIRERWQTRARWIVTALWILAAAEVARAAPHYLAFFNQFIGGPRQGYRYLVDSNLDWGQDLKALKHWLDQRGITEPINLCYFGSADPRYYGIEYVNLPGGYDFSPQVSFRQMRIPGYLAISATSLQGAYYSEEGREIWRRLLSQARLVDVVGYSLFVFRLDRWPG